MNEEAVIVDAVGSEIRQIIYILLRDHLRVKFNMFDENTNSMHFFGQQLNLGARDLVYLMYLLEKHFKIHFTESDIDNSAFYTLDGLVRITYDKIIAYH